MRLEDADVDRLLQVRIESVFLQICHCMCVCVCVCVYFVVCMRLAAYYLSTGGW